MSKKLEFRYAGDEHDDDYFRLVYNNVSCGERIHRSRKAAIACSALVSDFTAMQSGFESLQAKGKALDWLEKNIETTYFRYDTETKEFEIWDENKRRASGLSMQSAIENYIAFHETEEIPDKGDTMETKPETQNILEIRSVTENEIALFFDGERCSGDQHPSDAFGKIYFKLADYVTSLESRLAELESAKYKGVYWYDYITMRDELAASERRVAELKSKLSESELFETIAWLKKNADIIGFTYDSDRELWTVYEITQPDRKGIDCFLYRALADYREKHPEPEEDAEYHLKKVLDWHNDHPELVPAVVEDAWEFLAREKGDSHAD